MAKKSRVKWSASDVPRVGRQALELATEQRSVIEPRLPPGCIDGLSADLDTYEGKRSDATRAPEVLRTATRTQDEAARTALAFLSAARGGVLRNGASASERAAFGLKLKPTARKVSSVVAALDALVDGATRFPAVARSSGLLTADLATARALRAALTTADAAQETQKEKRKNSTADRRAVQGRIESAVDAIITAGHLAFIGRPDLAARFVGLVPGSARHGAVRPPPANPPS